MKKQRFKLLSLAVVAFIVAADQLTKLLVVKYLMPVSQMEIIPGVLNFTYVENPGAVGGIFSGAPWVFNVITVVAVIVLIIAVVIGKFDHSRFLIISVAFIVGGGIGNLIDRFYRVAEDGVHYVVDFIDVIFIPFWNLVFNIADCFVVIGCMMIMLYYAREVIAEFKNKKGNE